MTTAIYVRVSTDRQALTHTIDQQIERLRAHLKGEGQEVRCEQIFRDDGYSGATLNRPGLDRLRDQLREGTIDRVLIVSPDRLARNYVHQMVLLEEFERSGCQVHFLDQPIRQDPHDHLLLQIRGAVAEYERTLIAERMRRGRQMKLRAGLLLPWPTPPYGYRVHPDRPRDPAGVQIEPTEGAIVQEVVARYLVTTNLFPPRGDCPSTALLVAAPMWYPPRSKEDTDGRACESGRAAGAEGVFGQLPGALPAP